MKIVFISLFCLMTMCAISAPIPGIYDLIGSNNNSGEVHYVGYVSIIPQGDNFRLDWEIGNQTQTGIGIFCGNVLSVAYRNDSNWAKVGVVSFYQTSNTTWEGIWAPLGSSSNGREFLMFNSPL